MFPIFIPIFKPNALEKRVDYKTYHGVKSRFDPILPQDGHYYFSKACFWGQKDDFKDQKLRALRVNLFNLFISARSDNHIKGLELSKEQ